MRAHLKYLRYVVVHKLLVIRAGLAIGRMMSGVGENRLRWWWRLLVHDLSKFGPAEWSPYVATFYGKPDELQCPTCRKVPSGWKISAPPLCIDCGNRVPTDVYDAHVEREQTWEGGKRNRLSAFNAAWLHHIHANDHHWQHHVLLEDSGKVIVLIPPAPCVYEMVADWLAAGPKVHHAHTLADAIAETIVWYADNHKRMQMRDIVRSTAESTLLALSERYGVKDIAQQMDSVRRTRESITIVGG